MPLLAFSGSMVPPATWTPWVRHLGMRQRMVALLGLIIGGVAALWWIQITTSVTRHDEEMAATAVREDTVSHPAKPVAVGRVGFISVPRPVGGGQPAVSASSPAIAEPHTTRGRRPNGAEVADKTDPPTRGLRSLSAEEILRLMRESYARLASYADRGRLMRTWHEAHLIYVDVPFRTASGPRQSSGVPRAARPGSARYILHPMPNR